MKPLLASLFTLLLMAHAESPKWAATGAAIIVYTLTYAAGWVVRELRGDHTP